MNSVQSSDNPFNSTVTYDNLPVRQRNNAASEPVPTVPNGSPSLPVSQFCESDQRIERKESQQSLERPPTSDGFVPPVRSLGSLEDSVLSASPPCISSSPPLFEPPPLPQILAVPPLNGNHPQPRYPVPQGFSAFPITVPSTFPSPCSAFTELQPRTLRLKKSSNAAQQALSEQQHSSRQAPPQVLFRSSKSSMNSSNSSDRSNVHSPIQYDALSSSISSARSLAARSIVYCSICGQSHDLSKPHRYNYTQAIDADLCCTLCYQPLVDPLDTKCGHTFCTPCLKSHLAVQALCPVDRQIINYLECQQASKIVKRLLDKLLVACPNSQFCNTILERSRLEEHLRERCPGSPGSSDNAACCRSLEDPLVRHQPNSTKRRFPPTSAHNSGSAVSASSTVSRRPHGSSTQSPVIASRRVAGFTPRLVVGSHLSPFQPINVPSAFDRIRPDVKLPLSDIDETYDSPVVKEGVPVSVVIRRSPGCADLGFTFVGGVDTPLSCVLIQEIYLDGAVALDGRLRPGDQILEVNGHPITTATHSEAHQQLIAPTPVVQLTVFRESVSWNARQGILCQTQEEVFCVKLCKRQGKVLGIKLVGKKHLPGLYVLELVPGCEADCDGRLQKDDQILEINGIDLSNGTQEQAAHIINTASDVVCFKVSRRSRADTPDILRATSDSSERMNLSASLRTNQFGAIRKEKEASLDQIRFDKIEDIGLRTHQRSRSVQSEGGLHASQAGGSHRTETSSLHAFHTPSSVSEAEITNSTSHLIADDEDRGAAGHVNRSAKVFHSKFPGLPIDQSTVTQLSSEEHESTLCQERTVELQKLPEEPLGVTVAGGRHSQRGDTPVYVTNISPDCVLGRNQLIKRGDVILEVNGVGLVGLTHSEAVDVLRRASHMQSRVLLRLIDAPETNQNPGNFMPSWTFWLQLPPICQLTRVIHLTRGAAAPSSSNASPSGLEPLGFSILGGIEEGSTCSDEKSSSSKQRQCTLDRQKLSYTDLYPSPIVIKSIVPGLLAHRDGRLKCGDLILAVNNVSMLNVSHETAVCALKRLRGDVALRIISWPGTIV